MINIIKKIAGSLLMAACVLATPAGAQLIAQGPSQTQASGQATPRLWLVASNLFMTNSQFFGTGAITNTNGVISQLGLAGSWWTSQNVYALAPTFLPASGAHAVGLTVIIATTNSLAHQSNVVINVFPAYDTTGGSPATVSPRFGQLFGPTPIFTWTVGYLTNGIFNTNIPTASWEPATALGYTISNGITSNTTLTLIQTVTP